MECVPKASQQMIQSLDERKKNVCVGRQRGCVFPLIIFLFDSVVQPPRLLLSLRFLSEFTSDTDFLYSNVASPIHLMLAAAARFPPPGFFFPSADRDHTLRRQSKAVALLLQTG